MRADGGRVRRTLGLTLTLALMALVVPSRAGAAVAGSVRAGERCAADLDGAAALDAGTGRPLVCRIDLDGVRRWVEGGGTISTGLRLPTLPEVPSGRVIVPGAHPRAGDACPGDGNRVVSAETGRLLICPYGVWVETSLAATTPLPSLPSLPPLELPEADAGTSDEAEAALPYELGDPTGLPPGVELPPGFVPAAGSPEERESQDFWKASRWLNHGYVTGTTDAESINNWFVGQCAEIGWLYDPRRVERLPAQNPPAKNYDTSVSMVLGECRTVAGSATDPTRIRPWYLAWGISLRPGATQLELVVELRSFPRAGGRSG